MFAVLSMKIEDWNGIKNQNVAITVSVSCPEDIFTTAEIFKEMIE